MEVITQLHQRLQEVSAKLEIAQRNLNQKEDQIHKLQIEIKAENTFVEKVQQDISELTSIKSERSSYLLKLSDGEEYIIHYKLFTRQISSIIIYWL